jgi:glycosyltransferase involved in cell wall biosynthesis
MDATSIRTHVLQIVGNAIVGGMETQVARLVERLPQERFVVSVLAPFESPFTDALRALGADVVITAIQDEPSWHSIQIACALVRSSRVDVIQSHLPNAHVLAAIVGRMTGRPVLATVHGRALTGLDIEVQRAAGTHLAVVCRHGYFHALGVGVDAGHVHFVPNGVDTERFRPERTRTGALRTRFGIGADAPVVGFVGRLAWEKGPDVFLRTALSIRAQRPDARFIVVGDGAMLEQLQTFVRRFELARSVHFAGTRDDMPAVFNELDVLVLTSRSEAMPLALMEAMACGLPIVATKVGGVPDLVAHGVTGWIAPEGDYEALAAQVVDLLDEPGLRAAVGEAGRRRAVERFGLDRSVEATRRLLVELSAGRAEPGKVGTLRAATTRPIRTNGNAVKAAQP